MILAARFTSPFSLNHLPPSNYHWTRTDMRRGEYAERRARYPAPQDGIILRAVEKVGGLALYDGCGFYAKNHGTQFVPFIVCDGTDSMAVIPKRTHNRPYDAGLFVALFEVGESSLQTDGKSQQEVELLLYSLMRIRKVGLSKYGLGQ